MDSESERIFNRMQLHRLLEKVPNWSDQRLANELGQSESWVRKWRHRFNQVEDKVFTMYLSQSRAPKTIW
ncbi:MAG: helix-turn-helix domain-containing protein [Chloroflexota bacterium]